MLKYLIVLLYIVVFVSLVSSDRTKDKIYENVVGNMCFRRLNSTHQTGCSSAGKSAGSVGVLHYIEKEEDINFIINDAPAPPYAPILKPKFFTRENILKLRDSKFVSAIILINDTSDMTHFSQESKCPNQFFRHINQPVCDVTKPETVWNPYGTGLLHENFDIPIIFLANKNESDKVVKCFKDFNTDLEGQAGKALCSIELFSFMSAAGNSEVCIRRSKFAGFLKQITYCDPLQGKNIYGTLFPRKIVDPENRTNDQSEKIILISARLDTTSMFDGIALGALDSLASVATLITSAHYLRKIVSNDVFEKNNVNVLFVLFNGESYDYIGSQRFVYDLKKKNAFPSPASYRKPLTMDNIIMMIDIGPLDGFDTLSIYSINGANGIANKFSASAQAYNEKFGLNVNITTRETMSLPPVSAQTFLRENSSFPAFVVAAKKPENKFYHSVFDDAGNLKYSYQNKSLDFDKLDVVQDTKEASVQNKIRNIATLLALGVYDILTDQKYTGEGIASSALVDEFLYCYLVATKCRLFDSIFVFNDDYRGSNYPPQRYISVQASLTLEATGWAYRVFGFVLSEKVDKDKENCTELPLYWIPGSLKNGECRLTTQNLSYAISPAFEEEGYNFKSNLYSTWTESTWTDLSARIFLRPSIAHESFTFLIGLFIMIISFLLVYFVKSKADILFSEVVNAEHESLPAQC
ncbi:unnamed protein product [Chironomus riparius]|uniref:Nicastrin n=1 Tax=Chironomus riparius TaxID=315576 RepID=A0A9N9S5T1_9DIPT|nr:unnamed protein product [Chironomus riparius]